MAEQWQGTVISIGIIILLGVVELSISFVFTENDAYQQSILEPYHSYKDVVIFHYSIPHQTSHARWQFIAVMDDYGCTSRTVHIYLRHGSYPVISPDNSSFPDHMVVPTEQVYHLTTRTSVQPSEMPEFHLSNPLPGSWFAVAFIPGWNQEIKQQGISHRCHYSLASMAAWKHEPNVHHLHPGVSRDMEATSQLLLYKVYVPEDTWLLKLLISSCSLPNTNSTDGYNFVQPCVLGFAASAHTFPLVNDMNFTDMNQQEFVHVVSQPQLDTYYYISVVSQLKTTYTITVKFESCSVVVHPSLRFNTHTVSSNRTKERNDGEESISPMLAWLIGREQPQTRIDLYRFKADAWNKVMGPSSQFLSGTCLPVVPLARIQHNQIFVDSFLLQGKDWFTSWAIVTDLFPILVKFQLEPFVDIGGTLQTWFHLDSLISNLTSQVVTISICLNHGSPPLYTNGAIECRDHLYMELSTNFSDKAIRYFPYPTPGVYYISLSAHCYNDSSSSVPEPCELQEALVDLGIQLNPCVFDIRPCGDNGFCQLHHFRQFYFSSCHCQGGWKGWGCTDDSGAVSSSLMLMKTLLLTLSNLFFIPAIVLAFRRKFYTEAILYTLTMFFSIFYHACDVDMFSYCLMKYNVLQFCDFYSAILSFWVTVVAMADLPHTLYSIAHMVGALGIALGVEYQRTGLLVFIVPMGTGTAIMLCSWGLKCYHTKGCYPMKKKWLLSLLPGIALAISGLILFAFVETEDNYKYIHSIWHVIVAFSIIFLLPTKRKLPGQVNPQQVETSTSADTVAFQHAPLNNDSELVDIADYRLSSDLSSLIRESR
ncbi:post-GPI attachment to proteins factor 6-like isoform X1 [Tachypleus tridentatus]|uniref:post-GPI attachment to proteins factor 6-like isoform X1 n=2 Tax=Tachypleus tridentatus TaxID=6853 RepID=UPI003FD21156